MKKKYNFDYDKAELKDFVKNQMFLFLQQQNFRKELINSIDKEIGFLGDKNEKIKQLLSDQLMLKNSLNEIVKQEVQKIVKNEVEYKIKEFRTKIDIIIKYRIDEEIDNFILTKELKQSFSDDLKKHLSNISEEVAVKTLNKMNYKVQNAIEKKLSFLHNCKTSTIEEFKDLNNYSTVEIDKDINYLLENKKNKVYLK